MSRPNRHNEALLTELALTFLEGGFADLGRRISHEYETAFNNVRADESIRDSEKSIIAGHLRRARINSMLHSFAADQKWSAKDIQVGNRGCDSHVEIYAGRLIMTFHHVSSGQCRPAPAKYLEQNWELNEHLSQGMLFPIDKLESSLPSPNSFNLVVLHRTDEESAAQVGEITFAFLSDKTTLAEFSISDAIAHQSALNSIPEQELTILRKSFNLFSRRK